MKGSKIDVAVRTKKLARELRLDINSERQWNAKHPDEEPSRIFSDLDPDLGDTELIRQFMDQEERRKKS